MSPKDKRSAWRSLSVAERRFLLRALVVLPATAAGLRIFGLRRMLLWAAGARGAPRPGPVDERDAVRSASRLVASAARHGPYRASCLTVALTLQRMLWSQGIASDLRIGVATGAVALEAHAWVEHGGRPLIDGLDVHDRFRAFDTSLTGRSPVVR